MALLKRKTLPRETLLGAKRGPKEAIWEPGRVQKGPLIEKKVFERHLNSPEFFLAYGAPPGPKRILSRIPRVAFGGPISAQKGKKVMLEKCVFRIVESAPGIVKTNTKVRF